MGNYQNLSPNLDKVLDVQKIPEEIRDKLFASMVTPIANSSVSFSEENVIHAMLAGRGYTYLHAPSRENDKFALIRGGTPIVMVPHTRGVCKGYAIEVVIQLDLETGQVLELARAINEGCFPSQENKGADICIYCGYDTTGCRNGWDCAMCGSN